jgi:hypothetical protein
LMYYWCSFSSSWGRSQFNSEKLVLTVRLLHVFFLTNGEFFCEWRFFISFAQMNISVSVSLDTSVHFCTPWDNHVHALRFATTFHAAQFLIESVSSKFTYRQKSIPSKLQSLDIIGTVVAQGSRWEASWSESNILPTVWTLPTHCKVYLTFTLSTVEFFMFFNCLENFCLKFPTRFVTHTNAN